MRFTYSTGCHAEPIMVSHNCTRSILICSFNLKGINIQLKQRTTRRCARKPVEAYSSSVTHVE
ncbi:conserved hypothetical protein [Ricinus communis]|uniref:Uncharacterized protein n=1 Tax=Ricinus communis TaxID=3988 RepID=B9SC25_RICCO|nr:conserved hypothetical protein [Ricinus communis]